LQCTIDKSTGEQIKQNIHIVYILLGYLTIET